MNEKLLEMLACPRCHASLQYDKTNQRLICTTENLAYPVKDGIAVLLSEQAESIATTKVEAND